LAPKPPAPQLALQIRWQIVIEPIRADGEYLGGIRPHLFAQFAPRGLFGGFARIDPALGHLPCLERAIDALADEDVAVRV